MAAEDRAAAPSSRAAEAANSWASRLLGEEVPASATSAREGPWQDPPRRKRRRAAKPKSTAPWVEELGELIAEGLSIPQIARRLGVSREEVTLALAMRERRTPVAATVRRREREGDRAA
jgi:DNA-binding NarL/FixJ family response regulator